MNFEYDVCVVGGCGRVGLPLAVTSVQAGLRVGIHDIKDRTVAGVKSGRMPFLEQGAEAVLGRVRDRTLHVANDGSLISRSTHVIVVIGTPVDAHLNPTFHAMRRFFDRQLLPHLKDGQCVTKGPCSSATPRSAPAVGPGARTGEGAWPDQPTERVPCRRTPGRGVPG